MVSFTGTLPVSTASVYENDRDLYPVCWYRFRSNVFAAIPWPSTVYILFGACESSAQYVAGECSVNTHNWDWCVTDELMEKMRQSDCTAKNEALKTKRAIISRYLVSRSIYNR